MVNLEIQKRSNTWDVIHVLNLQHITCEMQNSILLNCYVSDSSTSDVRIIQELHITSKR